MSCIPFRKHRAEKKRKSLGYFDHRLIKIKFSLSKRKCFILTAGRTGSVSISPIVSIGLFDGPAYALAVKRVMYVISTIKR